MHQWSPAVPKYSMLTALRFLGRLQHFVTPAFI